MRRAVGFSSGTALVASVASVALAILATQHHMIHMVLLALGGGTVGLMLLRVRRLMGVQCLATGLSVLVMTGLIVWSVLTLGL